MCVCVARDASRFNPPADQEIFKLLIREGPLALTAIRVLDYDDHMKEVEVLQNASDLMKQRAKHRVNRLG